MLSDISLSAIGTLASPYKEKFAIPRQPRLINSARGVITLGDEYNSEEIVAGLTQFSHIWLIFVFHQTANQGWKPMIRPPRLGGNKKIGVLASRSTFRPNPIGMSAVKLERVYTTNNKTHIEVSGIDLLNGTPILDIKPYIPYSDSIAAADAGFADEAPKESLTVKYSQQALKSITHEAKQHDIANLQQFISDVLSQDPRPAYKKNKADDKQYGVHLYHLNIKWQMLSLTTLEVTSVAPLVPK